MGQDSSLVTKLHHAILVVKHHDPDLGNFKPFCSQFLLSYFPKQRSSFATRSKPRSCIPLLALAVLSFLSCLADPLVVNDGAQASHKVPYRMRGVT